MKPFYEGFSNPKELKAIKKMAAGKYWIDTNWYEYVSFTPTGKRKYFEYDNQFLKDNCRICAKLWAQGHTNKAIKLYNYLISNRNCDSIFIVL